MPEIATNRIGAPPRYPGKLLKTGQTTQYSGEADDGDIEAGLTKRYLILTTGQYSGACVFTLNGKTENQSHSCVRDLVTGLMWARYTSAESASVGPSSDGKMAWHETDDDIFDYVAAANAAKQGGHSDWRIPNRFELALLLNMEAATAAPDGAAFPSWPTSVYVWSASTAPNNYTYAITGNFNDSRVGPSPKHNALHAALVRGGV